jgi:hypothetical protein
VRSASADSEKNGEQKKKCEESNFKLILFQWISNFIITIHKVKIFSS